LLRWQWEDGRYVQATFLNQTWVRWSQLNPGSTLGGKPATEVLDVSLRRTRFQLFGQVHPRVFFYTQFGQNNFNFNTPRKTGFFLHDALGEVALLPHTLNVGAGLTAWGGPLRFTAPSVATILGVDAPIYQQTNNDVNDQFDRHLAVYAQGTAGRLHYRGAVARPLLMAYATGLDPLGHPRVPTGVATFNPNARQLQYSGFAMFNLWDKEAPLTPYTVGTYLGTKRILAIGGGALYQADAMHYARPSSTSPTPDTLTTHQLELGLDVMLELPLGTEGHPCLTAYAAYLLTDNGPGYVRNLGPDSPAPATASGPTAFNGTGTAFPMFGTGSTLYAQAGWKFGDGLLGHLGTLQVYASSQIGFFKRLGQPMVYTDAGLTWLIAGHGAKLTLAHQSRPLFAASAGTGTPEPTRRLGCVVAQLQVFVE
jgi:hypothetical protein